jgi:hypothetical protein
MKKLYVLVAALGFSTPAFAQGVPNKAFYVGLGGSASVTNFSDQSIDATGISNVYDTSSGAFITSGQAGGPPVDRSLDSSEALPPFVQAGYFQQFADSKWLWGANSPIAIWIPARAAQPF